MTNEPETSEPETSQPATDGPGGQTAEQAAGDDGGAALERAEGSIHEARDAEGRVAAHDDITTVDDARAGEYSEDPGGEGGHP